MSEGLSYIQAYDELKIEATLHEHEAHELLIALDIDDVRRKIKLQTKETLIEIIYENDLVPGAEEIGFELQKHGELLELAKKIKTAVQQYSVMPQGESVPEDSGHSMNILAKILGGMWNLLNFQSPFGAHAKFKKATDFAMVGAVLSRTMMEINEQKLLYEEFLETDEDDEQVRLLIDTMKEIIHELFDVYNSIVKSVPR